MRITLPVMPPASGVVSKVVDDDAYAARD